MCIALSPSSQALCIVNQDDQSMKPVTFSYMRVSVRFFTRANIASSIINYVLTRDLVVDSRDDFDTRNSP